MYLSIYLCTYLSIYVPIYPSMYLSIHLCTYLSIYVPIYLSMYISIYVSIYLSIYLSLYLSVSLSIYLSIYLSLYLRCSSCQWPNVAITYVSLQKHYTDEPWRPKPRMSLARNEQQPTQLARKAYTLFVNPSDIIIITRSKSQSGLAVKNSTSCKPHQKL